MLVHKFVGKRKKIIKNTQKKRIIYLHWPIHLKVKKPTRFIIYTIVFYISIYTRILISSIYIYIEDTDFTGLN